MKIQTFINEFKLTFVYELLRQTLTDDQLFEHSVEDGQVIWFKEQMRQMWHLWLTAAAEEVPDGFALVKVKEIKTWYQDDDEPENFCNSEKELDILGDGIEDNDIIAVNVIKDCYISSVRKYGVWKIQMIGEQGDIHKSFMLADSHEDAEKVVQRNQAAKETWGSKAND